MEYSLVIAITKFPAKGFPAPFSYSFQKSPPAIKSSQIHQTICFTEIFQQTHHGFTMMQYMLSLIYLRCTRQQAAVTSTVDNFELSPSGKFTILQGKRKGEKIFFLPISHPHKLLHDKPEIMSECTNDAKSIQLHACINAKMNCFNSTPDTAAARIIRHFTNVMKTISKIYYLPTFYFDLMP